MLQIHLATHAAIEKRNQEIQETMLKARNAKYSVPVRYGKVLFCGAAAAGKSNFLKLLMKEDFQPLHISTAVLKPQQVTIAVKALLSGSDDEVEFTKMSLDDEILHLESYLPKEDTKSTAPPQKIPMQASSQNESSTENLQKIYTTSGTSIGSIYSASPQKIPMQASSQNESSTENLQKIYTASEAPLQTNSLQADSQYHDKSIASEHHFPKTYTSSKTSQQKYSLQTRLQYPEDKDSVEKNKLVLADMKSETQKLDPKRPGQIWDILTFMDTGGQLQFISMLPAVNSFAMITFIIHKMEKGGQNSLSKIIKVQYGNEKGEVTYKPHPHKYNYLQLTETLISYASNILLPDTKFLEKVKIENKECKNTRSILLVGTHSGDNQVSEKDIKNVDKQFTKVAKKSGVDHIKPGLNKNYQFLVPVDNNKQSKDSVPTKVSSVIYRYMQMLKNKFYQAPVPGDNNSETQIIEEDTKRYTNIFDIRKYIQKFLNNQDEIHVPIKWLLLELEIRKVCQQRNCNLMSYDDVLKLAKERILGYNGEFGDGVDIDSEQFIKQGLRFHHSFGVLLYFEDVEGMQKLVITNHQWLFNKLSKIVEYSFTCDTQEETKDLTKGIFKKSLLGKDSLDIGKDFTDSAIDINSVDPINAFLKLLEQLRIAAPLTENDAKYFMPCLLDSCKITDLKKKVPEYKANNIKPLLIQFKSTDNKTYSFPRGAFCFLVVELMMSMKWEPYREAYVDLLTLFKKDTAHYVTLIDRIFYLEVHVTYRKDNNIHDEVREIINKALHIVGEKLKIDCNLCYGFTCPCQLIREMHISYIREDNDKYCCCSELSPTKLTDSHTIWLTRYHKVSIVFNYEYT